MKLITIVNGSESFKNLSNIILPAKDSFKVSKLIREVEQHINDYNDARNKLLKKYGESKDQKEYTINKENVEVFKKELIDLGETEITINSEKIKIGGDVLIKPQDIMMLEDFISIADM